MPKRKVICDDILNVYRNRILDCFIELELPDDDWGWSKLDGECLIATPSGLCSKESLSGKLMHPREGMIIKGMDGHESKRARACRMLAQTATRNLEVSVGTHKEIASQLFLVKRVAAKHCEIRYERTHTGRMGFTRPFPFFTVQNKKLNYYRIIGVPESCKCSNVITKLDSLLRYERKSNSESVVS